jgi:hypothetical protein
VLVIYLCAVLTPLALAQSSHSSEPRVLSGVPQQSHVGPLHSRINGHLVQVDTVIAPSETVGLLRRPLKCDDDGNVYLRTDSGAVSAIHKLNLKGEKLASFDATLNPNLKVDVASYFTVAADGGELYELVYPHEMKRYIFIYGSDGAFS